MSNTKEYHDAAGSNGPPKHGSAAPQKAALRG
jgi:hypothetical protein